MTAAKLKGRGPEVSLVSFIDILGFADRVAHAQSVADVIAIDRDLETVQAEFEVVPDHLTKDAHKAYRKKVLAFSDCLVTSVPINSQVARMQGTFDALGSEVASFALAQGACVARGIFLRGGIDLGYWHMHRNRMVSGALVKAYRIEQSISVPVLGLTSSCFDFFKSHAHRGRYSPDADPVPQMFLLAQDEKDKTSFPFINYLEIVRDNLDWAPSNEMLQRYRAASEEERQQIMQRGYEASVRRWFKAHSSAVVEAYRAASSESVAEKYRWLAKYHNETVRRFRAKFQDLRINSTDVPEVGSRYKITRLRRRSDGRRKSTK